MRGPAAPTSPGAWDARSEALLGTPALTPADAGALDLRAADDPADALGAAPPGIAPSAPETPTSEPPAADLPVYEDVDPPAYEDVDPPAHGDAESPVYEDADPPAHGDAESPAHGDAEPPAHGDADRPDAPEPGLAWRATAAEGTATAEEPTTAAAGHGAVAPVPAAALTTAEGPGAPAPAPSASTPRPRRGNADPVKVLMHRHRELCERAVDPLEIAAGLEAQGFTDRTAARFRHRDVFALAEELYVRVPRGAGTPPAPAPAERIRAPWLLAALAPGAAAALAGLGLTLTHGSVRLAVGAAGALALTGALLLAVRRGPLRAPGGRTVPAARLWTLWLLAYAVAGDGLLAQVLTGGPDGPWALAPGPLLALALAVAPAAWGAHLFASRARRRIADSRGLADFAAGARPLLLGTVTLQLLALTVLLALTGFSPGALALGALLLLARLLTVHGFPETATAALAAACAAEALALASVLAARIPAPGFDALAAPVRSLVDAAGPGAVPTLVCGAAALGLLAHATGALARASAHATTS
ncbi:hypothetical protein ASC82_07870 [Streptomyces sp. Root431]|uniref:hypothetical protein n=1 Tax=Streptomyces sp. Root431 TaxID=1736535 RepID=UPI0006F383B5|nr:hypothetical protein [Streptomyces sp. Root431]KQX13840.1 hypothetical protein ASC82_07870 [Streptomyces sp. Root431]